jgi:hypothetical protein
MKQNEQNYEQRLADLNKKLGVIQRDQTNKLLQAVASYELVKEVIGSLPIGREMQNSIQFNKIVFPQFLSLLIYYRYMVSIFSSEPLRKSDQIAHLKAFRKKLEWFCLEHRELIQYCRSGATDRDDYYLPTNPINYCQKKPLRTYGQNTSPVTDSMTLLILRSCSVKKIMNQVK